MRTLQQVEDEIAALQAANRMSWAERNECTDLKESRRIRLKLASRLARLDLLMKERRRLQARH